MADVLDVVTNLKQGPATVYVTPYDSGGSLAADDIVIGLALNGVDCTQTETFRKRTADSILFPLKYVLESVAFVATTVCQDMSPSFINQFLGGELVTDAGDGTKTRINVETTTPFRLEYGANVKIVDNVDTDYVIEIIKAEVYIESLDLSKSTKKDMTFTVKMEAVHPNSGTTVVKIGSTSAA